MEFFCGFPSVFFGVFFFVAWLFAWFSMLEVFCCVFLGVSMVVFLRFSGFYVGRGMLGMVVGLVEGY